MGGLGYQKQGYGMSHDAQEQSYDMNQESSWHTPNKLYHHHHQGHASGMPSNMYPQNQAMLRNSKQSGYWDGGSHHSMGFGGKRMPTYGGGGGMLNNHDQMENSKYERFHEEVIHAPAGASRVQGMRYERSSWGDDFGRNNYRGSVDDGINWKRNGGQQFEWVSKGV